MPKNPSIKESRRSKGSYKFAQVDPDDIGWETVIDFTDGGKKAGVSAQDVLKALKKMRG